MQSAPRRFRKGSVPRPLPVYIGEGAYTRKRALTKETFLPKKLTCLTGQLLFPKHLRCLHVKGSPPRGLPTICLSSGCSPSFSYEVAFWVFVSFWGFCMSVIFFCFFPCALMDLMIRPAKEPERSEGKTFFPCTTCLGETQRRTEFQSKNLRSLFVSGF